MADRDRYVSKSPMILTMPEAPDNGVSANTQIKWNEDLPWGYSTTLAAAIATTTATSISVASGTGTYFTARDYIKIGTEMLLITAISSDTLTVTRGYQSTTAATAASGATVKRIGNARVQGADVGTGIDTTPVTKTNSMQIFITEFTISNTDMAALGPGGNIYDYKKNKHLRRHFKDIDLAIKENVAEVTPSSGTAGVMKGLDGIITTITNDITDTAIGGSSGVTTLTRTKAEAFLKRMKDNGGTEWMVYAGNAHFNAWQQMLRASGQSQQPIAPNGNMSATYGFLWSVANMDNGQCTLIRDENAVTGTGYYMESSDPLYSGPALVYMGTGEGRRKLELHECGKTGDGKKYFFATEVTLQYKLEQMSGILKLVASGA